LKYIVNKKKGLFPSFLAKKGCFCPQFWQNTWFLIVFYYFFCAVLRPLSLPRGFVFLLGHRQQAGEKEVKTPSPPRPQASGLGDDPQGCCIDLTEFLKLNL